MLLDKLLPKLRAEAHCVLISNPNPNPSPSPSLSPSPSPSPSPNPNPHQAHCVLIFSQFTMMLDLLADFLKERRFA